MHVAGRDAGRDRPARRRGVDRSRWPRDRREPGPPPRRRQDLVHRIVGHRQADRRVVRRTAQAGQPRTRRQVGRDHPRRRRHRPHRQAPQDGQPDEQRAGLRGADPDPGQRAPPRRGRRRARRNDVEAYRSATPPTKRPTSDPLSRNASSIACRATSSPESTKARGSSSAAPSKPHDRGWYVRPTLFTDATNEMRSPARRSSVPCSRC